MKTLQRISIFFILALISAAVFGATPGRKVGVSFDRTHIDFGSVSASTGQVHMDYTMTNGSSGAVAILSARASCGCTEPSYPKKPVMPGESAVISVNFNTRGQRGEISKEVTVKLRGASGKTEKVQLVFTGVVVP